MEDRLKHLEFIQNVITRMNTNSYQIKALTIMIVSAFLAVYASSTNIFFIFIGIFSTALFWFLDSYYLQQERKFRGIYDNVSGITNDITIKPFEMPIQKFVDGQYNYCKAFLSKTIIWLYLPIIILLIISGSILYFF